MLSVQSYGSDPESCPQPACDDEIDVEQSLVGPLLLSSNLDPMKSISFRPLEPKDRGQIQKLHEEWFPVSYKEEFYDDLVLHRMVHSGEELVTCAAVYRGGDDHQTLDHPDIVLRQHASSSEHYTTISGGGQINGSTTGSITGTTTSSASAPPNRDSIVACIVGSKIEASHLSADTVDTLLSDPSRHKRMFYIMTLGTVKEFRKLGLATLLLQKIMDMVQEDRECGTLYLHVITFNVAAIRFYEKLGFYRVKEMKNYYCIDGQNYNCYVYAKYYHGNFGQLDYYYLLTTLISNLWRRVTGPFMPALLEAGVDRNR